MCYNPIEREANMARPKTGYDKNKYDQQFHKENYVRFALTFRNTETDIIDKLNSVPNKVDYIRQLILADIQKEKETID